MEIKIKVKTTRDHKVVITDAAKVKLENALDEVQTRSQVRCILNVDQLLRAVKNLEFRLSDYIPLSKMQGIKCNIDLNSENFSKAYKYTPFSTIFSVECLKAHSWIITEIKRDVCYEDTVRNLILSDEQKELILKKELSMLEYGAYIRNHKN